MTDWYKIKRWLIRVNEDYNDMQWPCPDGFHVPLQSEFSWLKTIMDWLGLTTWDGWRINLHIPFAWWRDYDTTIGYQGTHCNCWSSSPYSSSYPTYSRTISLNSSYIGVSNAGRERWASIRAFKDEFVAPTSSWTVIQWTLWSAWIFWNQSDWLISITSNWTTGYTIMDKNLGATTVYNNWDTLTQANMWNFYQRWNNYGFPSTWTISKTSSTQVNASTYWPWNYYNSDTWIINIPWDSSNNDNLRWWVTQWSWTRLVEKQIYPSTH
jgi:hypothetical protein